MDERREQMVGRLYAVTTFVGVSSFIAAGMMVAASPRDLQAVGLCLIAAALAFGLAMNAAARR